MKKLTLFFVCMFFGLMGAFAQVSETETTMSQGKNNAFTINLEATNKKNIEKAWMKYIKKYDGKTKKNRKTNEIFTDNAELKDLSSNTVDIYATVVQKGEDCVLTVWYDMGGAFLNSQMHNEKVPVVDKMLNEFGLSVSTKMVEEDLKNQEKMLKKLAKEQKNLEKEKKNLESEIAKCEKKIKETKAGIQKNLEMQKEKQVEIEKQKAVVKEVSTQLKKLK